MKHNKTILLISLLIGINALVSAQNFENFTHAIANPASSIQFWTCPPTERVFKNTPIPATTKDEIKVYCAKNETEPFILNIIPYGTNSLSVDISEFGTGISVAICQVKYVNITQASDNLGKTGDYPDPLWPIQKKTTLNVNSNENTSLWFSIKVDDNVTAGDYSANISIGNHQIKVQLHVFDFSVPTQLHVKSQMNFNHNAILEKYGVSGTGEDYWKYVDAMKQFFIDHRLTPKNPLWSGGLTSKGAPYIDYDCEGTLSDPHGIWGFELPAKKYLSGDGFNNGTGFPSFMAMTFSNNDASQDQRPSTFCGQTRSESDWVGSSANTAYNTKWFKYINTIQQYLDGLGYLDKSYYYFANEPQDSDDYDAVAWYSQELKKAAPQLKLMVSEEPKAEIYNHPLYTNAKIDIWLPVLNNYKPEISHDRKINHEEDTWIYFLHSTRPPYFNPITLDHPGIESKLTGWFLWKYRIRGIAYYAMNNWSKNPWTDPMTTNHNGDLFMLYPPNENNENISYGANNHKLVPSIRIELMRDGFEDYEYLYLLNNKQQPEINKKSISDTQADKIITALTSYNRDSEYMYNLRRLIGMKLGGEIDEIPELEPENLHARSKGTPKNYYINFQDPNGAPNTQPLVIDNKEYQKIGWNSYDENLGYGWFGDMSHVMYKYLPNAPNVLQGSVIYDDWGREKTFEYDLPNGEYNITISIGWHDRNYNRNKIDIEGISFVNDEASNPYIIRTKKITINDYKLTMNMGIFDEYTMLNYLNIEAVSPVNDIENKTEALHYKVYPNPFTEVLTIKPNADISQLLEISIFDLAGKKISAQKYRNTNHSIQINTSKLLPGCYIVKIKNTQGQIISYKCHKL